METMLNVNKSEQKQKYIENVNWIVPSEWLRKSENTSEQYKSYPLIFQPVYLVKRICTPFFHHQTKQKNNRIQ